MTTPMPPELSALVSETLDAMRKRDDHHILPIERDRIYQSFRDKDGKVDWRPAAWLSLRATQKVFPMMRELVPLMEVSADDRASGWVADPGDMLEIAEDTLKGRVDIHSKFFGNVCQCAYNSSGGYFWGFKETELPETVFCVGEAIYSMLCSIHGDPFSTVRSGMIWQMGTVQSARTEQGDSVTIFNHNPQQIYLDENLTDQLMQYYGDAAPLACAAYSMVLVDKDKLVYARNLEKCREFWEWWLTEAIPEVWAIVSTDAHASDSTRHPHDSHNSNAKE